MPITNRFGKPIWRPGESTPAMVQRSLDEALADPGPDASRQGAVRPEAILHPPLYIDSIGRERGVSFIRRGLEVEYRISMEDEGAESRNLQEPEQHTQRRQYLSPLGDLSRRPNFLEASSGSTTRASGSAHHRSTRPTMPIPRAPTPRPQLARSRQYQRPPPPPYGTAGPEGPTRQPFSPYRGNQTHSPAPTPDPREPRSPLPPPRFSPRLSSTRSSGEVTRRGSTPRGTARPPPYS